MTSLPPLMLATGKVRRAFDRWYANESDEDSLDTLALLLAVQEYAATLVAEKQKESKT